MVSNTKPDYYDEPDDQHERVSGESEDAGSSSVGTIPKSLMGGKSCNVGDTVTLKITAVYEDEYGVEPSGKKEETSKEDEGEETTEASGEEAPAVEEVSADSRYD